MMNINDVINQRMADEDEEEEEVIDINAIEKEKYLINYTGNDSMKNCIFKYNGCPYICPYDNNLLLNEHEKCCNFRVITCILCKGPFLNSTEQEHAKHCPKNKLQCPNCLKIYFANEKHNNNCSKSANNIAEHIIFDEEELKDNYKNSKKKDNNKSLYDSNLYKVGTNQVVDNTSFTNCISDLLKFCSNSNNSQGNYKLTYEKKEKKEIMNIKIQNENKYFINKKRKRKRQSQRKNSKKKNQKTKKNKTSVKKEKKKITNYNTIKNKYKTYNNNDKNNNNIGDNNNEIIICKKQEMKFNNNSSDLSNDKNKIIRKEISTNKTPSENINNKIINVNQQINNIRHLPHSINSNTKSPYKIATNTTTLLNDITSDCKNKQKEIFNPQVQWQNKLNNNMEVPMIRNNTIANNSLNKNKEIQNNFIREMKNRNNISNNTIISKLNENSKNSAFTKNEMSLNLFNKSTANNPYKFRESNNIPSLPYHRHCNKNCNGISLNNLLKKNPSNLNRFNFSRNGKKKMQTNNLLKFNEYNREQNELKKQN